MLRGNIVKDDCGAHEVFTEQGSSASQMTAAKIMDVIASLPGCAGQAADAVSAYTHVKMEDAPRHKWPKSWSDIENPVVLLERNFYGHPVAGLFWERQFEEVLLGLGLFLSVYVDDITVAGGQQNMAPEPTSFFDHENLGCTQRESKPNEIIIYGVQQNVRITNFCWSNLKITRVGKPRAKGGCMVLRFGRTCSKMRWERDCELANKKTEQLFKVSRPCLDDHHFKKKEDLETVGELSKVLSPFVAIPTVSLELLRFGYRLLILALVTFLALAFALAILALAHSLRFPCPVLARRESRPCASLIDIHWHRSSRWGLVRRRYRGPVVSPQRLGILT